MSLGAGRACVVDLDGVVWLAGRPLPGATEGVAILRRRGVPVRFVTNNSMRTRAELLAQLEGIGIPAAPEELLTSGQAAASLLEPGSSAHVVGGPGLREALAEAGVQLDERRPHAVVAGLTFDFDYASCELASNLVRGGARFIATNSDATLPTPEGLRPGAGAIVAAIATAAGVAPEVAGKPFAPMASALAARGPVGAVVGDRISTDGAFAARLGVDFVHVASEVDEEPGNDVVTVGSLLEAVQHLCGV